jgi:hypothetical protein
VRSKTFCSLPLGERPNSGGSESVSIKAIYLEKVAPVLSAVPGRWSLSQIRRCRRRW